MTRTTVLLATFFLVTWPVNAKEVFRVLGAGVDSCGTWTAERRAAPGFQNSSWVLGYVTGFNRYGLVIDDNVAPVAHAAPDQPEEEA
jgi:hypothetical protein